MSPSTAVFMISKAVRLCKVQDVTRTFDQSPADEGSEPDSFIEAKLKSNEVPLWRKMVGHSKNHCSSTPQGT